MTERSRCPVLVVGCPRSGTNLLYDTLLSAGGFAIYRGKIPIYQLLVPRAGRLDRLENRKKLMALWLRSEGFRRSGLDGPELAADVLENCRTGCDFLCTVMNAIARKQNVARWAVYSPDSVLRIGILKREIPNALFIHILRDGRDIALSLRQLGDFNPFPWTRKPRSLQETALYWEWMVQRGCRDGVRIQKDYAEVRYEDLVTNPRLVLASLAEFLDHDLDYNRIQAAGLGTLSKANSSFEEELSGTLTPIQRWKRKLSPAQVASLEWHVGATLQALGYPRTSAELWKPSIRDGLRRAFYQSILESKLWLKSNTPLGKLSDLSKLQLTPEENPRSVSSPTRSRSKTSSL